MQRGGSQGSSQGTAWPHLFNSDSYSGSVMWALVRGQAAEPWHSEGAGWRARAVVFPPVLLWTSGMGRPRGGTRAPAGGRQRGSRWFGQSAAGAWSRRAVSVFHCLTLLSAARPGVGRGAQGRKQPSRGNPSSSPWGPHGHVSSPPGASVSFSVNHLHSPPYLPSWEQCEVMRVRCFDEA